MHLRYKISSPTAQGPTALLVPLVHEVASAVLPALLAKQAIIPRKDLIEELKARQLQTEAPRVNSKQLLGRWGSQAIRLYTRQAALERSATWASRAVKRLSSEAVEASHVDEGNLKGTIKRLLKEALSSFCPGLSAKQAEALRDDVVRELRRQATSSGKAASGSEPAQTPGHFIKNAARA
jgi:hypothetical protein